MAACCENILHHSVLDLEKKQVNVTLTSKYIAIEDAVKQKQCDPLDVKSSLPGHCQVIPVEEVIAVQPHVHPSKDRSKVQKGGAVYQAVELQPLHPLTFDLYIVKRDPKHRWGHRVLTFTCRDHSACSVWVDKIKDVLSAPDLHRPKHLLVFVNPYGGKKRAPKVFEKVRPFFDLAGISLEVIETQRQNHAREVIQTFDLSSVDGVLCVGGDGTFSEVLNGLLDRSNKDSGVDQSFRHQPVRPTLRIGVIPAGSTDSVVFTTVGSNDPLTSALQIIVGSSVGVDVNALYKQEEFVKYSVTMISYGYYGDLLADSERYRWMGPKRYNFSGFKKFLAKKSYEGHVSFLPADKSNGHPQDKNMCYSGCIVCQRAGKEAEMENKALVSDVPTFDLGSCETDYVPSVESWPRISGKFVAISCVTVSCRCALSPQGMSSYTHLGDGCMDLILVFNCSRAQYLRHLMRIPRPDGDQFDFNFVKVFRVREFQFCPADGPDNDDDADASRGVEEGKRESFRRSVSEPQGGSLKRSMSEGSSRSMKREASTNSVWNCDGELVEHPSLHVQVHCQLVRLFARGVEDMNRLEPEKCPVCCNPCSRF